MLKQLRSAIVLFVIMTLVTGIAYPLLVTAVAQIAFPAQANGSLIQRDGQVVGSALIGQPFDDPAYFWSRPSATGPQPYNGAASGGNTLASTNQALIQQAEDRIAALQAADPGNAAPPPVDLVTASGSGLDPHISIAAARYQQARVAQARQMDVAEVAALVDAHSTGRWLGFWGEPRVNVLELNLALDALATQQ
jgi:K+-transporting ATPase ATPase C chain